MIVTYFGTHMLTKGNRAGEIVPGFQPYRASCSWTEFVNVLRAASEVETDPRDKIKTLSISMADFEPGKNRGNKYALRCDWIGIDLDNKPDDQGRTDPDQWTVDRLAPWLDDQGLTYVIYTTSSCREGAECLRLLLPLSQSVTADDWPLFWGGCNAWLGGKMDPQTKDVSRLLFEPRKWIGAYNRFIASPERVPLNVDRMFDLVPAPATVKVSAVDMALARSTIASQRVVEGDLACLDTSPIIPRGAVTNVLMSPQGGRLFKFLCACAVKAAHNGIEVSAWDMERLAANIVAAYGGDKTNAEIERDAVRAIEWANRHVTQDRAQKIACFAKSNGGIF